MKEEMRESLAEIMRELVGIMKVLKHKMKRTSYMLLVDVLGGWDLTKSRSSCGNLWRHLGGDGG